MQRTFWNPQKHFFGVSSHPQITPFRANAEENCQSFSVEWGSHLHRSTYQLWSTKTQLCENTEMFKPLYYVRLSRWHRGKESTCQQEDAGLIPGSGSSPWRRKWQSTLVFLPGKSHGQRSLAGCSPWGHKRVRHDLATKQLKQPYKQLLLRAEDLKNDSDKGRLLLFNVMHAW